MSCSLEKWLFLRVHFDEIKNNIHIFVQIWQPNFIYFYTLNYPNNYPTEITNKDFFYVEKNIFFWTYSNVFLILMVIFLGIIMDLQWAWFDKNQMIIFPRWFPTLFLMLKSFSLFHFILFIQQPESPLGESKYCT